MKHELFAELLESVREGGAILRGEKEAARRTEIPTPAARQIREQSGLSQRDFATMMGISTGTLRNWEQGRRKPEGPARVLLTIVSKHPDIVWNVVAPRQITQKPNGERRSSPRCATRKSKQVA